MAFPLIKWVLCLLFLPAVQTGEAQPFHTDPDPCEAVRPRAEAATLFSKTPEFSTAFAAIREKTLSNGTLEYNVGFGRDAAGSILTSPLSTGNRSNSNIPPVPGPFADLHNHPRNTPPSSGDLYGLIRVNKKTPGYLSRYVATKNGSLYAFVVTDTAAARAFIEKFPPQQVPGYSPLFPDALLNEYRDVHQKYGAAEELAMAFILQKYAAGVALLKQDREGKFQLVRTRVSGNADHLVFTADTCQ
jgi:hypothetical protein